MARSAPPDALLPSPRPEADRQRRPDCAMARSAPPDALRTA